MRIRRIFVLLTGLMLAPVGALAGPVGSPDLVGKTVLGGSLYVTDSEPVTATFRGEDAGYFNSLYFRNPTSGGATRLFDSATALGTTVTLGSFAVGTELSFELRVDDTGDRFTTGSASSNPDGVAHARATTLFEGGQYLTVVGMEDLFGGGDRDYNDFMFELGNVVDPPGDTPLGCLVDCPSQTEGENGPTQTDGLQQVASVPAPQPLPLMIMGLAAFALARLHGRRRRR